MPYRGLLYFVTHSAHGGDRLDPYASEHHDMPDPPHGVRYTQTRRNPRRISPYPASDAVREARGTHAADTPRPAFRDVEPLRFLAAAMLVAAIAFGSALAGVQLAQSAVEWVDTASAGTTAEADAAPESQSTPQSQWQQGQVPELYQTDTPWANRPFGEGTLGTDGAAALCLAMARIDLTGDTSVGPVEVASTAQQMGYADRKSTETLLVDGAAQLGLEARSVAVEEMAVRRELVRGRPIIALVRSEAFGSGMCCIVLTDIDEHSRLEIRDPQSVERTERTWSFEEVLGSARALYAYRVVD